MMLTEEREDLHTTHALNGMSLMVRRIQGEYDEMPGLTLTERRHGDSGVWMARRVVSR
jgi:hypothetical protein